MGRETILQTEKNRWRHPAVCLGSWRPRRARQMDTSRGTYPWYLPREQVALS